MLALPEHRGKKAEKGVQDCEREGPWSSFSIFTAQPSLSSSYSEPWDRSRAGGPESWSEINERLGAGAGGTVSHSPAPKVKTPERSKTPQEDSHNQLTWAQRGSQSLN